MFSEQLCLMLLGDRKYNNPDFEGWGGVRKDSIPVSNSCYHRGANNPFQKMFIYQSDLYLFWRYWVINSVLMIAKFRNFETYFHVFLD